MIFYALSLAALSTICDAAAGGRFVTTNMVNLESRYNLRMLGIRLKEKGVFAEMKQFYLFNDAATYLKGRESQWKSGNPPGRAPVPFPERDNFEVSLQEKRTHNPKIEAHIKLTDDFDGKTIATSLGDTWYAVITKDNDRCAIELIYRSKKTNQNTWVPSRLENETGELKGKYYLKIGNHSEKMKKLTWDVQWRPAEQYKVGDKCMAKWKTSIGGNNKPYKAIIEYIDVDENGIVYHIRWPQDGKTALVGVDDITPMPELSQALTTAFRNPTVIFPDDIYKIIGETFNDKYLKNDGPGRCPSQYCLSKDLFVTKAEHDRNDTDNRCSGKKWEPYCPRERGVHIAQYQFGTVSADAMKEIYQKRWPHHLSYTVGTFECADFAVVLHGVMKQEQFKAGSQYPFAVGEAWTREHALNVIITQDNKVLIFEPQNGKFYDIDEATNNFRDEIHFIKF